MNSSSIIPPNTTVTTEKSISSFYNLFKPEYLSSNIALSSSTNLLLQPSSSSSSEFEPNNCNYTTCILESILYQQFNNNNNNTSANMNSNHLRLNVSGNSSSASANNKFLKDTSQFILEGLGITLMTIFGLIGNTLSIITLTRKCMINKPINRLLLGLAITDTVYILGVLIVIALPNIWAYYQIDFTTSYALMTSVPIIYPIGMTAQTSSVYYTIMVTIERYIAVCHPILTRRICTKQRTTVVTFLVLIFSILFNIPRWFEFKVNPIHSINNNNNGGGGGINNGGNNVTRYLVITGDLRKNKTYEIYYIYFGYFTFICSIPIIVLITLNSFIYHTVKSANNNRKHLSSSEEKENSLAVMLIFLVIIFVVCNMLSLINLFARLISGKSYIQVLDSLRNFALVFNSSINFIIYCTFGEKFRSTILQIFHIRGSGGGGSSHGVGNNTNSSSDRLARERRNRNRNRHSSGGSSNKINTTNGSSNNKRESSSPTRNRTYV